MKSPVVRVMFFLGVAVAAAALGVAARSYLLPRFATKTAIETPVPAPPPSIGGAFDLVDATGKQVTDADFRGRYMLVYFGYTMCPQDTPTTLTTIAGALDELGAEGELVVPVFITLDPERDPPQQLAAYLDYFHPRQVGLTGTPEQIAAIAEAYGIHFQMVREDGAEEDDYSLDHTSIVFLIGPAGKFRHSFSLGTGAGEMAALIRGLL